MAFNGTGSNVTSLNATNIASSTIATARLATGTANSTTFLRGDGTWASAGSSALTDNTLQTITSTTTTTIDVSDGNVVDLTMASNITTLAFSNVPASGTAVQLVITFKNAADGTAYNVTWPANIYWNSTTGAAGSLIGPTLTAGPNSVTVISLLTTDGGTKWQGWTEATIPGQSTGNFLYSWGNNFFGDLGQNNAINLSSPTQVGSLSNWAILDKNYSSASFAIKSDGTLWGWGYNDLGQLGLNDTVRRSSPVQVGTLTDWAVVSGGSSFTIAIKTNGTLWSWGNGARYRTGQGNTTNRSSPTQVGSATDWAKISAGDGSSLAIKTNGTLWAWGNNTWGAAGNGSGSGDITIPTQTGSDTNWAEINSSFYRTIAIKTTGTMWAAGYNYQGSLGLGQYNNTGSRSTLTQIGSDTNWSKIASGRAHTIAKKTTGALWGWGLNNNGQLGQNNRISRSTPVQVGSDTDWDKLHSTASSVSVIKTNGTLWAWGDNSSGQLGLNDTIRRSSPVQVGSLTTWSVIGAGGSSVTAFQPAPAINPA